MSRKFESEVRTFMTSYRCGVNGKGSRSEQIVTCPGTMTFDGVERKPSLHVPDQPLFRHKCDYCGAHEWLNDKYPKLRYERKSNETTQSRDLGAGPSAGAPSDSDRKGTFQTQR